MVLNSVFTTLNIELHFPVSTINNLMFRVKGSDFMGVWLGRMSELSGGDLSSLVSLK